MDHRLLAVDADPRLQRVDRDAVMPVIGRSADDRVDIVACEDLAVVPRREEIRSMLGTSRLEASVVAVRRGHQLHAGDAKCRRHVGHAHPASADDGQVDLIVRRAVLPGHTLRHAAAVVGRQKVRGRTGGQRGSAEIAEEGAPGRGLSWVGHEVSRDDGPPRMWGGHGHRQRLPRAAQVSRVGWLRRPIQYSEGR